MKTNTNKLAELHRFFFYLLIAYMLFQSIRGIIEVESLRKIRWVAFYGMIGSLAIVLHWTSFTPPSPRRLTLIVTLSTLVLSVVFIVHGLMTQVIGGISQLSLERTWGGTASYVMFPLAIALPAIIISINDHNLWHQRAGLFTLFVVIGAGFYYESRVVILSTLAALVIALPTLGIRRFMKALLLGGSVLFMFIAFIWPMHRDLRFVLSDLFTTGSVLWELPRGDVVIMRDIDRYAHARAAFLSIADNWQTLLFGYGYGVDPQVYYDHLEVFYETYYGLPQAALMARADSPMGFSSLVVDTGIVGLLLLITNLLLAAWQVRREQGNKYRLIIISSVGMLFLWLFVINMLDITLFYLAIMPSGLLLLMARSPGEKTLPDLSPAVASHRTGATR